LLSSTCVLLLRCAWHSRYHGYPRLLGIASWRGFGLQFTDGICPSCASRVMDDGAPTPRRSEPARWPGGDRAAVLFVGIPLMTALVLAAAPLSEPPALTAVAALPLRVVGLKRDGVQRVVAVPSRSRAPLHGTAAVRARIGLSARAIVRVAEGIERADTQAP
jgi:hypothetical protein